MNTKIYVAYHTWAPRIDSGSFVPIHVGRAEADAPIPAMIGDDTGDHISHKNPAWCELTALYWAWKNDRQSTRIGLMHYRRVLDVLGQGVQGQAETQMDAFDVDDWVARADAWIERDQADIVVPRLHVMGRSVAQNYKSTHNGADWDATRYVIAADFPHYLNAFDAIAAGHSLRLGNLAIMTRAVLDRYCTFVFGVLEKVERADVDRSNYSAYQGRYLGFLAERLLTVFVENERLNAPEVTIAEVGILKLDQARMTPYFGALDRPSPKTVNIAVSADRAYLPHAAAMLVSVLDHADPDRPINLFFLHPQLDPADLDLLRSMLLAHRPNLAFHPINSGTTFDHSYRSASRAPSNATYNRFLLFSLLPGLDRVLYLDCDMIIQRDVCALYDTDMGTAQIGAVTDWIMTRTLTGSTPTADPEVPDLGAYQRDILGLNDVEIARYFNAGVLLINFAAMQDPLALGRQLMGEAREGRYMFRDQDILNKVFKGALFDLDPRWNVFSGPDHLFARVPQRLWDRARAARRDPWIVHFADRGFKPWEGRAVPLGHLYLQAAARTPFVGEAGGRARATRPAQSRLVSWGKALAARVPVLRRPLLWAYHLWWRA